MFNKNAYARAVCDSKSNLFTLGLSKDDLVITANKIILKAYHKKKED